VTGETLQAEEFLQLRQAWVSYDLDEYVDNTAIKVGRQRVREPYGIWWNNDQDAVRVSYDTTQFKGSVGVGQNLFSYNTAEDEFRGDNKDRFRAFAEASWLTPVNSHVDVRALYEDDHSSTPSIGTSLSSDERDDDDSQLVWLGARVASDRKKFNQKRNFISYRADIIGVVGEVDSITTAAGSGTSRVVTGADNVDVAGWAFDGQVDYRANELPLKPVFTAGYAYGSGDDDNGADGKSNAFIQSDMHSNTSNDIGSSRPLHNYGEAFRPELSNLHIMKLGATANLTDNTDMSLIYRKYILADEGSNLRSSRVRQNVNGNDKDVGQGVDVVLNSNIAKEFDVKLPAGLTGLNFRSSLGVFRSGDAFENTGEDETLVRGLAEAQLRF
jgi:alginate production protein